MGDAWAWWAEFVLSLSGALGPGPAVALVAFIAGGAVFALGGIVVLWVSR